jgi:hypothetical protein
LALEENKLMMYVRWHQEGLVELANSIYAPLKKNGNSVAKRMLTDMDSLLDFFDRSFRSETNSYVEIARHHWEAFREELVICLQKLRFSLGSLGLEATMGEILMIPLTNWLDERVVQPPTYQQYRYTQRYVAELLDYLSTGHKITAEGLLYEMVELNFNHLRCFHLWISCIEEEMKRQPANKELVLKKFKRKLLQVPHNPTLIYNDHATGLRDQLARWLEEEMSLLLDELQFVNVHRARLKVNLPIGALAYLNKLLFQQKFFDDDNQSLIMRHMVDTYTSIDTEEMSLNSYGSKYRLKEPSDATARAVRKLLKPMLEEVERLLN